MDWSEDILGGRAQFVDSPSHSNGPLDWTGTLLGDATPERGGRAKRYFASTKPGRAALINAQQG
jgi:hypothetical protein